MSFLARTTRTTARTLRAQARGAYHGPGGAESGPATNWIHGGMPTIKRSTHAHQDLGHLPFDYKNKTRFTAKAGAFLGTAFAIPFVAMWWRWHRPGGLKNP